MRLLPVLIFFAALIYSGCTAQRARKSDQTVYNDSLLMGNWRYSYEEEKEAPAGYRVYRRVGAYTFPPSRGRVGFEFFSQGKGAYIGIAPTDGSSREPGVWGWTSKDEIKLTLENGKQFMLHIKELTHDRFIARVEQF